MLHLSNSPEGQIKDPSRTLISSTSSIKSPHVVTSHSHPRGQLLSTSGGISSVTISGKAWSVSSQQAVWIQPNELHEVSANGALDYCSVFIDPYAVKNISVPSGTVTLSPLVRELMLECANFKDSYKSDTPESRLVQVLYDRITTHLTPEKNAIPLPSDTRLHIISNTLLNSPWHDEPLSYWSQYCGASERTLARLFHAETGQTFSQWRDRVRVSYAVERIISGDSVTTVSVNLGYRSTSAFISMFKRSTGSSPMNYMKKNFH